MGTVRQENAINQRRIDNKVLPAVALLVSNSTIGTPLYVRIDIDDPTTVSVTDVSAYDFEDAKTIFDALANGASDTGVVFAKDSEGVKSIST